MARIAVEGFLTGAHRSVCRGYGGGLTPLIDADGKPIITKDGYQK